MLIDILKLLKCLVKYVIIWVLLHTRYCYVLKDDYWLVSEKRTEARDNGYHMYKFLRDTLKIDTAYYAIEGDSHDASKIREIGGIVNYNSFYHCLLYMGAKNLLYCQIDSRPYESYRGIQRLDFFCRKDQIRTYLKHGIAKDDIPNAYDYRKAGYDIFICGAKPEYNYYKERYNYPKENIAYTGLCRYDALVDNAKGYTCLIMPTYREWLRTSDSTKKIADSVEMDLMKNSDYFKNYVNLLNDENLKKYCEEMHIKIFFYIHYTLQPYVPLFERNVNNPAVTICKREDYDVQRLLLDSSIMVTDYSSVAFDFVYMEKPVAYYQFDEIRYREQHYKEGYYNYKINGLGPVYLESKDVIFWIKDMFNNQGMFPKVTGIYENRKNSFFEYRDTNNCRRVYDFVKGYTN